MEHLNPTLWSDFRARRLAPERQKEVRRHLAEPCEICDEVLAGIARPDALDPAVDGALADLATLPPDPARLRALEAKVLAAIRPRRSRLGRLGAAGAALAACSAALLLYVASPREGQRLKGERAAPTLAVFASEPRPGQQELVPIDPSRGYPQRAELFLRYELTEESYVYLARVGADGGSELLAPEPPTRPEPAGTHALSVDGIIHSYSLEGLEGVQRFVLITSEVRLTREQALASARGEAGSPGERVEVRVKVLPKERD